MIIVTIKHDKYISIYEIIAFLCLSPLASLFIDLIFLGATLPNYHYFLSLFSVRLWHINYSIIRIYWSIFYTAVFHVEKQIKTPMEYSQIKCYSDIHVPADLSMIISNTNMGGGYRRPGVAGREREGYVGRIKRDEREPWKDTP